MRHFQTGPLEPTLHVEALVRLAAIQDTLIASHFRGYGVKSLDDFQAEFLSLLVFCDGYIFDVADYSEIVDTRCYY